MSVINVSVAEAAQKLASHPSKLIDVRTPAEFEEMHAQGARNIPLDKLDPKELASEYPQGNLYVICRSGGRGRQACEKMVSTGVDRAVNVEGGTLAWEQAGLPVVRGRKTMSLERQVRITAGSLVAIGVALGFGIHQAFFGLSAFIGCGLVFAGITDTCGMGMVLAKMPWNNRKPAGERKV